MEEFLNWISNLGRQNPQAATVGTTAAPVVTGAGQTTPGVTGPTEQLRLGINMPSLGLALGGLNALGNLSMANKSLGLARDQFNFQRDFANTNMNNQLKTFNDTLAGRTRVRGIQEGWTQDQVNDEVNRRSLSRA